MAKPPAINAPENETNDQQIQWELAHQWKRAWRVMKWVFTALVFVGFLLVIGQMYLYYNLFSDIHPWLGIGFVATLTVLLLLLVGRPLVSFLGTPVVAKPPALPVDPEHPTRTESLERLAYDIKYLKALLKNPALKDETDTIRADIADGTDLLVRLGRRADQTSSDEIALSVQAFEQNHIEPRLSRIDAEVDRIIHAEAVGVGVATAVSMNGTVDAFIVLWRNANLVARISRLYFGRPHLRGSLMILRDVAAIVVLSRALEDVTDLTGEVMGGLLGRMGGVLAGPVMDGAINAMMTLKLGYLTKRRCRSFKSWSLKQAVSISKQAMQGVKRESASVIADLLSRSGGLTKFATRAGEKAWHGSKSAWSYMQGWFGNKEEKPG